MLGANVTLYKRQFQLMENIPNDEPRVLILQRAFLTKEGWLKALHTAIKNRWLMVVEYDDYPENPFNAKRRANSLDWERFQACHAVQASTPALADVFLEHNPEVGLFENHLLRTPDAVLRPQDKVRIFFGALNRKSAWLPLIETYNKVLDANPDTQVIVLHDDEFFEALRTKNKAFKKAVDYDQYLRILHSCDVCLQPLDDTKFNRYKSDIKFIEASAGGLVTIASPIVYQDYIEHGRTGLIADGPNEWKKMLSDVIKDIGYRKRLGRNAKSYVLNNRMLMQHAHKRLDWYRHLWANRVALNERLFNLYPQIRPTA